MDDNLPGWASIIDPLIERCRAEGVHIYQIKQKFGTLRFYVGAASKELQDAIQKAERESEFMCELCGKSAALRERKEGLRTLCGEHAAEWLRA